MMDRTEQATTQQEVLAPRNEHRMQCMELWGGVSETQTDVAMTGLDGFVFSRPYDVGKDGGDVYYFTSCASGRISRILLADVAGHGLAVSETAGLLRSIMRRKVNVIGQSSLMTSINEEFSKVASDGGFATAIVLTYFEPTNSLTLSAAGHPPPLLFRKATGRWSAFGAEDGGTGMEAGLPLGVSEGTDYTPQTIKFHTGDMLLAYTDAFFESKDTSGALVQTAGLLKIMNSAPPRSLGETVDRLVSELRTFAPTNLSDDDATAILLQPTGSGIPMKNNVMAPIRMIRGVTEIATGSEPT